MNRSKRVILNLSAIVIFVLATEAYLIAKSQYAIALIEFIATIVLVVLVSFVFDKKISSKFFQTEIIAYLSKNNDKAKKDDIIDFFLHESRKHDKATVAEIVNNAIDMLVHKNKVVIENETLKRVS